MMKKTINYFNSSKGSVVLVLIILFVVQGILHTDFWNWGEQTIYFGWITREFLYRFILVTVVTPLSFVFIEKISWPIPKNDIKR